MSLFTVSIQFESESHDIYTPIGAPRDFTVAADSAGDAETAATRLAFAAFEAEDPGLWSPALRVLSIEDLHAEHVENMDAIAHAEHRAHGECYQFEGDECPTCDNYYAHSVRTC